MSPRIRPISTPTLSPTAGLMLPLPSRMPSATRKLVAASAAGTALGTPRPDRRSTAPSSASSPAARESPITALVGMPKAKPAYFCFWLLPPMLSHFRKPQMNISTPRAPPIIDIIRSRCDVPADPRLGDAGEPYVDMFSSISVTGHGGRSQKRYPFRQQRNLSWRYPDGCAGSRAEPQREPASGGLRSRVVGLDVPEVLIAVHDQRERKQSRDDQRDAGAPPARQPQLLVHRPPAGGSGVDAPEDSEPDQERHAEPGHHDPGPGGHPVGGGFERALLHRVQAPRGPVVLLGEQRQAGHDGEQPRTGEEERSQPTHEEEPAERLQHDPFRRPRAHHHAVILPRWTAGYRPDPEPRTGREDAGAARDPRDRADAARTRGGTPPAAPPTGKALCGRRSIPR